MSAGNNALAVKTLVEFAARQGSLQRGFTPGPTAEEGIAGHKRVTQQRSSGYSAEVSLQIAYAGLEIRGRADGYCTEQHCLEEIKTFYGDVEKIPENLRSLHWAQLKCYGWMLCEERGCEQPSLALIYFNLHDEREHRIEQVFQREELRNFGEQLVEKYAKWQALLNDRRRVLHRWVEQLQFPYAEMYTPQRQLAETVYKAASLARVILAEAPTGTGKTLATLFPAIKALSRTPVDKIFFLTAKSTGKQLALNNLRLIASDAAAPLRILELTAIEKACLAPESRCHGDSCSFALDFYTKLDYVREVAANEVLLDKSKLADLARAHDICPFYLSMEMSRWVDVVVADINYYFDINALLFGLTKQFNWKPYLLVDESHNLVDRSRAMYTAELQRDALFATKKQVPADLKKILNKINRCWLELIKHAQRSPFAVLPEIPEELTTALQLFTGAYINVLQHFPEHPMQTTVAQDFFFSVINFLTLLELKNEDFCVDLQAEYDKQEILTLRNIVPASMLQTRISQAHSSCFFSATMRPEDYFHRLLGLPDNTVTLSVPTPFAREQLQVHIARHISTRYRDRAQAIEPICQVIVQQLASTPGNAMVYFSSYEFLHQVKAQLAACLSPDIVLLTQARNMSESQRQEFIETFLQHNRVLGLAVLGGVFSEGIDLVGDALKGVFIATLGMPQFNPINDYQCTVLKQRFSPEKGYNFTYLYPGIQKVIQAAGRVIRSRTDQGYVWLLDDRYQQAQVKALLPDMWQFGETNI